MATSDRDMRNLQSCITKRTSAIQRIEKLSRMVPALLESDDPDIREARSILRDLEALQNEVSTETDTILSLDTDDVHKNEHTSLVEYVDELVSIPVSDLRELITDTLDDTSQTEQKPSKNEFCQMEQKSSNQKNVIPQISGKSVNGFTKLNTKANVFKPMADPLESNLPPPPPPDMTFQRRLAAFNRYAYSAHSLTKQKEKAPKLAIQNAISDLKESFSLLERVDSLPPDAERTIEVCFEEREDLCNALYQTLRLVDEQSKAKAESCVRFEKQRIPKFSGKFRDYVSFKKKFTELVQPSMSASLAYYVRLKDEALRENSYEFQLVRGTTSLTAAWRSLDKYFGRPSLVKDSVLSDLMKLPPVSDHKDAKRLRSFLSEIVSAAEDLRAVGLESALGDSALSCLMTKIPDKIREIIDGETFEENLTTDDQLKSLLKQCDRYASVQETHDLRSRAHGFQSQTPFRSGGSKSESPIPPSGFSIQKAEDGYFSDE